MKPILIIVLMGLLGGLSACAPVLPASLGDSTPQPTSQPGPEIETPAGSEDSPPAEETPMTNIEKRDLPWDTDPEALIISATFCCGFVPPAAVTNYIPDAQVWGDGRIVWVEENLEDGSRRVFEGHLDLGELELLINRISDAGFFEWEEYYANPQVADFADKCIRVNLKAEEKSVCEYYEGAPQAFHDLYNILKQGAGASGAEEFVPDTGFLTAEHLDADLVDALQTWEAAETGVSLSEASEGVWVEGPALQAAWEAVNLRPWNPLVKEGDSFYILGLQLPNLSMSPPPNQPK